MAEVKSDVVTLLDGTNPSTNVIDVTLLKGTAHIAPFNYDPGATIVASGDTVLLTELPAGARVWGIYVVHDDLDGGGSTTTYDIGDAVDDDRYVSAITGAAQTGAWLALRSEDANLADKVLGIGFKHTAVTRIVLLVNTLAWVADAQFSGFVLYSSIN